MRLASTRRDGTERLAAVHDGRVVDLVALARATGERLPGEDLAALLAGGREAWERLAKLLATSTAQDEALSTPLEDADLGAPYVPGAKILCHVVNYSEHGAEADIEPPARPFFFTKPPSSVVGPHDPIVRHRWSELMDYEVELAAVIGRPGRNIPAEQAHEHVAGYTVVDDVSYRDLQFNSDAPDLGKRYGQNWTQGKGLDGSCPIGPWITLADELDDPYPLGLRSWVDGELRQDATTEQQIFRVPALVEFASRGMTLWPGDVIATGTPAGSAIADGAYLRVGQTVRCEVDGLGALVNEVVADDAH